ncbi:MAG: hypothetical protein EXX96DRAFT_641154 [Benjaminiella poitrasii]|nr:MAG: hypothetical protein EXX96DRAFT_641154 [Benjaminiella poitrasii]
MVRGIFAFVQRLFLKRTLDNSVLIDILNVKDQNSFLDALDDSCSGNEHLWSVSNVIRGDTSRYFAEVCVSPYMRTLLTQPQGFKLNSFENSFFAYDSFSRSAEILKIFLSKLPPLYGRKGGEAQLTVDIHSTLSCYGKNIACSIITNSRNVFSSQGYVGLERDTAVRSNDLLLMAHVIDWAYKPIDYFAANDCTLLPGFLHVSVHASWAFINRYTGYGYLQCRPIGSELIMAG